MRKMYCHSREFGSISIKSIDPQYSAIYTMTIKGDLPSFVLKDLCSNQHGTHIRNEFKMKHITLTMKQPYHS
jgi:hypothetical protein